MAVLAFKIMGTCFVLAVCCGFVGIHGHEEGWSINIVGPLAVLMMICAIGTIVALIAGMWVL